MTDRLNQTHIETDDARAGQTPHVVRWMLGVSLALAVIAMTVVWLVPALSGNRTIDDVPVDTIAS
jgi:hypothetical protein